MLVSSLRLTASLFCHRHIVLAIILLVCCVFRFFLASFYTKYDQYHFVVNAVSLLAVLIPKLPQFDGVRLFGINAY